MIMMTKNSRKIWISILCIAFLAVFSCALFFNGVTARAVSDVMPQISTYEDFVTSTATVDGTEMSVVGPAAGWGGYAKVLTFDRAYDLSEIWKTGKGALTFYMYFGDEKSLAAHQGKTGGWEVDISGVSFSDNDKITFSIASLFSSCKLGWNKILLPFSAKSQDHNLNYAAVQTLRLNCVGAGFNGGECNVAFAGFTFTQTNESGMKVLREEESPTEISMGVASTGGLNVGKETIDGTEYDIYTCVGLSWGGNVVMIELDKSYDASGIDATGKGAFVLYMYFADEATLNAHAALTKNWNIDVGSGDSYSDAHKYSFQIAKVFADCRVGWNKILLPFATAGEKNDMDWSDVKWIRLNYGSAGLQSGQANLAFAGFGCIVSDESRMKVLREEEPIAAAVVGISDAANLRTETAEIDGTNYTSYSCEGSGWGSNFQVLALDKSYDLTELSKDRTAVFAFYMYFADAATLNAHAALTQNWAVDVGSGDSYSDSHKYSFVIATLFERCTIGWNRIILPFTTADEKNDMDWSDVRWIRLNWSAAGFAPGQANLAFAGFTFTIEDETGKNVVNADMVFPTIALCGDFGTTKMEMGDTTTEAFTAVGYGWNGFVQMLTFAKSYDLSALSEGHGALSFWMYIADDTTLAKYKTIRDFWSIDVSSGGSYSDEHKYSFMIASVFPDMVVGWNRLILPFSAAAEKNGMDWTEVSFIRLNCTGVTFDSNAQNSIAFAKFAFIKCDATVMQITDKIEVTSSGGDDEDLNPISEKVIIDCNSVSGLTFSGNKVNRENFRYGTGCVYTSGAGYALAASDLDIGKTDLRKSTFVLCFWLWIENVTLFSAEGVNGQVEISSSGSYDTKELNWEIPLWGGESGLQTGWNWIVLKGSDATVSGGAPDFDKLSRFRIYVNNISNSIMMIDRITIGYIENQALFAAPDWEKEVISRDAKFVGPNAEVAENSTYLETDMNEAKGFVAPYEEEVTVTVDGCGSNVIYNNPVAVMFAIGTVAVVVILLRKKKS